MLLIRHPPGFAAERQYAFEVVLGEFLGVAWHAQAVPGLEAVEITVAGGGSRRLRVAERMFATDSGDWLTARSVPSRLVALSPGPPPFHRSAPPALLAALDAAQLGQVADGEADLSVDVFGSAFFALTRYEEVARPELDEHERVDPRSLLMVSGGAFGRPLIDEYVEILREALEWLALGAGGKRPAPRLRLSHDVDWPSHPPTTIARTARTMLGDIVRRRDPTLVPTEMRALLAQRRRRPWDDPFNSFGLIMDTAEQHGLRSAFYFMTASTDPRYDPGYDLAESWIAELLRQIHARGHEIGLHPSYGTLHDPDGVIREFELLREACRRLGIEQEQWGGRQHFLRFSVPESWRAWEAAGLDYDSSLGFSSQAGFRSGTCREHPVFDLRTRRRLRLRERPLVAMEMALIDGGPAHDARAREEFAALGDRCASVGGDFTILWHNSRLASRRERRLFGLVVADAMRICGAR